MGINGIKTIGIVGGGQLGKMMILDAKRLGLRVVTLDPSPDCPSASISDELIIGSFNDEKAYHELAKASDVITYEFEHINVSHLEAIKKNGAKVFPSITSLKIIQDKFTQKQALADANIPVPAFERVESLEELQAYFAKNPQAFMLKARCGGYDGKGNFLIKGEELIAEGFNVLGGNAGKTLMAEELIHFTRELSIIATRSQTGEIVVFPIAENVHINSILDTTTVPAAKIDSTLHNKISEVAKNVMDCFKGVGTFCVELFIDDNNGDVWVNEVAPRVHNSGHYTIEACRVSQFENHIRAIIGLGLGSTELLEGGVVMKNIIGKSNGNASYTGIEDAYRISPNLNIHIYGKTQVSKGRKMGHYTVTGKNVEEVKKILEKIEIESV
jgi:5-(carboxyamino)imidazole ribonucleotide synthase